MGHRDVSAAYRSDLMSMARIAHGRAWKSDVEMDATANGADPANMF